MSHEKLRACLTYSSAQLLPKFSLQAAIGGSLYHLIGHLSSVQDRDLTFNTFRFAVIGFAPILPPMAELPLIDPEAIENLRALNLGDNDEFLREIIGIFLEDTPQRMAELDQSLAANDVPTFTRAAHSIKGSSSNLGTLRLREIAEKLEHDARKTGLGEIAADVAALKIQFAEVQVALRKYFSA